MLMWYHIGSSYLGFGPASNMSYPILYFLPILIISLMNHLGIASFFFLFHFMLNYPAYFVDFCYFGCLWLVIIWSTMYAHSGLSFFGARYFFSHIICIASILISMLSIFNPPISLGCDTSFQLMIAFLSFYM